MKARRFKTRGVEVFRDFVTGARENYRQGLFVSPVPQELLFDADYSEATSFDLADLPTSFDSKFDIGAYFSNVVPSVDREQICKDASFWSWAAAFFFDALTNNRKKIKEPRAYVASIGYQEFYRHLLLGPFYIFISALDNPERVRVLLYDEPTTMNEVMVQVGSYQVLMQNPEIQDVVTRLYFDRATKRIKRGAGGKINGAPRRLMDFFNQIELNFDLRSIRADVMMGMLPAEFDRFKRSPS